MEKQKTKPQIRKIKGLSFCDDCQHMVARQLIEDCFCLCHDEWKEEDDRARIVNRRKKSVSIISVDSEGSYL